MEEVPIARIDLFYDLFLFDAIDNAGNNHIDEVLRCRSNFGQILSMKEA